MEESKPRRWSNGGNLSADSQAKARELRAIALHLNRIASEIEINPHAAPDLSLPSDAFGPMPDPALGKENLADVARAIHKARQRRYRWFDRGLFGEPAWDILLDAYHHKLEGKPLATKSACWASGVASTTALRWIRVLEEAGLLHRFPSATDRRKILIELTDEGLKAMTCYLLEGHSHGLLPQPFPLELD